MATEYIKPENQLFFWYQGRTAERIVVSESLYVWIGRKVE
jgi:hypothetical protein